LKRGGSFNALADCSLMRFLVLEEEMEKDLQQSFGDGSGPG